MQWSKAKRLKVPGPGMVLLVPVTKMLRIPNKRPDRAYLEEKIVRMRGFDARVRVAEGQKEIDLSGVSVLCPPRVRFSGVRAYHRGPTKTVREFDKRGRATKKENVAQPWVLLESWSVAEGEKTSQKKLEAVRSIDGEG